MKVIVTHRGGQTCLYNLHPYTAIDVIESYIEYMSPASLDSALNSEEDYGLYEGLAPETGRAMLALNFREVIGIHVSENITQEMYDKYDKLKILNEDNNQTENETNTNT